MKAIVTGANGFIGTYLTNKLISEHIKVFAIDISFNNTRISDSPYLVKIECELNKIDQFKDYLSNEKIDIFYHLAWMGVNGPEKANMDVQVCNIQTSLSCAKLAKDIGCKKFLCSGTIAERNVESLNVVKKVGAGMFYGVAKLSTRLMVETYCKSVDLPFVWMQFSNIFGPMNKTGNLISYTLNQLNKNEKALFGPASQPYDFIYVDDLINAVFLLGTKETKETFYYIGSGSPRLLKEYLLEIGDAFGKKELICLGSLADDGIKYSFDMFSIDNLKRDIGEYISLSFSEAIIYTIRTLA